MNSDTNPKLHVEPNATVNGDQASILYWFERKFTGRNPLPEFKGTGIYDNGSDFVLILPTENGCPDFFPSSIFKSHWHKDKQFVAYYFNCQLSNSVVGWMIPKVENL